MSRFVCRSLDERPAFTFQGKKVVEGIYKEQSGSGGVVNCPGHVLPPELSNFGLFSFLCKCYHDFGGVAGIMVYISLDELLRTSRACGKGGPPVLSIRRHGGHGFELVVKPIPGLAVSRHRPAASGGDRCHPL